MRRIHTFMKAHLQFARWLIFFSLGVNCRR